ncbi:MAG: transcription antitermination factor NusB [Candidatus Cloacimonetes bacterium]|nr:transcription antitermination factor NusB [Candidatus Cloacimonadota bacterium]
MGVRRKSREIAIQTLYSLDFAEKNEFLQELGWIFLYKANMDNIMLDQKIKEGTRIYEFAEFLLKNSIQNIIKIDEEIAKNSQNWSMERLALLDKSVLRIAIGEILFTDTPHTIIMNEAIEISKKFCSEGSGKFINGILNAISKNKV